MKRLLIILLMCFYSTVHAVPFENIDWKSPGDNLITRYTGEPLPPPYGTTPYFVTNLEWLNVGLTVGQSFNDVLDQTKPAGQFEGFRFATPYEIIGLLCGPLDYVSWQIQDSPQDILDFFVLTGLPVERVSREDIIIMGALYDMPNDMHPSHTAAFVITAFHEEVDSNMIVLDRNEGYQTTSTWIGSFLVREQVSQPVPEPTTLLLLGFGLLGVAGVSRRKN